MSRLSKILEAASETRALRIGQGIINEVPDLFKEQFPGRRAIIVADTTTYRVAGDEVFKLLKNAGISQEEPFIYPATDLYAEYTYIDQLTSALQNHDAIPIAVGSGTINDLTKLASHLTGRRYMCVATAASMDGYTAFGASITAKGAKQTFDCPAPLACLADIEIIRHAPEKMTASGYADLFAKVTAGADWILADALGVETIDKQAWSIIQDGLHDTHSNPQAIAAGNINAISKLTEGLMLGGFAMQRAKSSRPASGAEHQFSHLWNMEHLLNNGESISHGFQVSIGTLAILAFYEQVIRTPLNKLDIEACCRSWPTPEDSDAQALHMFAGTSFPSIGLQETRAKYLSSGELAVQLNHLKRNWDDIRTRLSNQIVSYSEAKKRLQIVGAPTEPEDIGMTRSRLRETFIRAQYIRRRFTVLDLAVRTGHLSKWLDELFSKRGSIWEI
ncbi:MAG: sn-glycerol-1-phosphate dehydrogenase [Bacteroidales bacterium]|nr:sn-glycerol-1-phosphate dehydrogenase [Bacteroidales bacterium]